MNVRGQAPLLVAFALGAMLVGALLATKGGAPGRGPTRTPERAASERSAPEQQSDTRPDPARDGLPPGELPAAGAVPVEDEPIPEIGMTEERVARDISEVLRRLATSGGRRHDLVHPRGPYEAMFRLGPPSVVQVAAAWDGGQDLKDGQLIVLREGVHAWDVSGIPRRPTFPADLVIEGAGMDKTLLRLNELQTDGEVRRLTFRKLTIDCSDQHFTDIRGDEPVSISLVDCRIVGFDNGAGGSVMLRADVAAFHAVNSRFETGFARTNPGLGNLFRVRKALLVRMDGCTLVGPFRSVFYPGPNGTYLFSGCRFEGVVQVGPTQVDPTAPPGDSVRFENCVSVPGGVIRKRRLAEINPAWR